MRWLWREKVENLLNLVTSPVEIKITRHVARSGDRLSHESSRGHQFSLTLSKYLKPPVPPLQRQRKRKQKGKTVFLGLLDRLLQNGQSRVEKRRIPTSIHTPKTPVRTGRMKRSLPICLFLMFRRAVCFTLRRQPKLHTSTSRLLASTEARLAIHSSKSITSVDKKRDAAKLLNLSSVTKEDLTAIITSWGYPKFRANQIWQWIRVNGVTDVEQMTNLPKDLRAQLDEFSRPSILKIELEQISKDGTVKRAYRCQDGQLIESVLMPYEDGRYTACISSQAGCAQGCVFCATGQMGFARQLTSDEIFEQVARFAAELKQRDETQEEIKNKSHGKEMRLSSTFFFLSTTSLSTSIDKHLLILFLSLFPITDIVFMGMG